MYFLSVFVMAMLALSTGYVIDQSEDLLDLLERDLLIRQNNNGPNTGPVFQNMNPEGLSFQPYMNQIVKQDTCGYGMILNPVNFNNNNNLINLINMDTKDMSSCLDGANKPPLTSIMLENPNVNTLHLCFTAPTYVQLLCLHSHGVRYVDITCMGPDPNKVTEEKRLLTYGTQISFFGGCVDFLQFKADNCSFNFNISQPSTFIKDLYGETCTAQTQGLTAYQNNIGNYICSPSTTQFHIDGTTATATQGSANKPWIMHPNTPYNNNVMEVTNQKLVIDYPGSCAVKKVCASVFGVYHMEVTAVKINGNSKTRGISFIQGSQVFYYGCTDFVGFEADKLEIIFHGSGGAMSCKNLFGQCCK